MKKLLLILFAVSAMSLQACGVKKIDYGSVGVQVNTVGDNRGVDNSTYTSGYVFFNPITQEVFEFPKTQLTRTWTKSPHEGGKNDDSITFSSNESSEVNADIYIAYHFTENKVPYVVRMYKADAEKITDNQIRSAVRSAFGEAGGKMKAIEIAGPGLHILTINVKSILNERFNREGIVFDDINVIGRPRLPEKIQIAINEAIAATQQAIAAENSKRITKAQAEQAVIKAQGEKEAIAANPYYIQTKIIDTWGRYGAKTPMVMGGGINTFNDMTKYLKYQQ